MNDPHNLKNISHVARICDQCYMACQVKSSVLCACADSSSQVVQLFAYRSSYGPGLTTVSSAQLVCHCCDRYDKGRVSNSMKVRHRWGISERNRLQLTCGATSQPIHMRRTACTVCAANAHEQHLHAYSNAPCDANVHRQHAACAWQGTSKLSNRAPCARGLLLP
jgi:hypothetical protein